MPTKKFAVLASAAAAAILCQRANAAVITWTVSTISGDTDVIDPTSGQQLVAAYAFGSSWATATTVNGVYFSQYLTGTTAPNVNISSNFTSVYSSNNIAPNVYYSTAIHTSSTFSTNYQDLLGQCNYGGASGTVTLTGLTQNDTYEVEVWAEDDRGTTRAETLTGTTNVTVEFDTTDTAGGLGDYAIGTFVADGSTQAIPFTANSSNVVQINDLELVEVPEPAALGLLVGGAAMLLMRRKRRGTLRAQADGSESAYSLK